jgi:MoxR-like ATPase
MVYPPSPTRRRLVDQSNSTPSAEPARDPEALRHLARTHEALLEQIERRVIGQREVVELLLVALFAGGHALFVGVPGLAKTLLVSSLAEAMDLEFARIQFTPDLMPSDITGSEVLEEDAHGRRNFRFVPGAVFCNLLLADEINRTPPKTQAALLQAMQEAKVSAGGKTHPLPLPFHVFATQNPIEQEGTYPLPEAQLDRFMLEILVAYPDEEAERKIVALTLGDRPALQAVLTPAELMQHQQLVRRMPVPPSVVEHVVALLRTTRPDEARCPPSLRELLRWGAGPRAGQQLVMAAQARAALAGREAVSILDVRSLAPAVLRHRLVPSFAAESRGVGPDELIAKVLEATKA